MKEELITLSKDKGFISRDNLIAVNDSYYYLWMCEVQKWLREKHDIYVLPVLLGRFYGYNIHVPHTHCHTCTGKFDTYELALEQGLLTGLKLIK